MSEERASRQPRSAAVFARGRTLAQTVAFTKEMPAKRPAPAAEAAVKKPSPFEVPGDEDVYTEETLVVFENWARATHVREYLITCVITDGFVFAGEPRFFRSSANGLHASAWARERLTWLPQLYGYEVAPNGEYNVPVMSWAMSNARYGSGVNRETVGVNYRMRELQLLASRRKLKRLRALLTYDLYAFFRQRVATALLRVALPSWLVRVKLREWAVEGHTAMATWAVSVLRTLVCEFVSLVLDGGDALVKQFENARPGDPVPEVLCVHTTMVDPKVAAVMEMLQE